MELDQYLDLQNKPKRQNKHEESDEQMHFVCYVRTRFPALPMWVSPIFKLPGTPKQQMILAMVRRRMGYTPGTPDITFLVCRRGFSGLVLEFKRPGEKPSSEQEFVMHHCRENNKSVHVVFSCDEAIKIFNWYMDI